MALTGARPVPKPSSPSRSRRGKPSDSLPLDSKEAEIVTDVAPVNQDEPPAQDQSDQNGTTAPKKPVRGIGKIATEMEQIAAQINGWELQIRAKRQILEELSAEMAEAMRGPMAAVGLQFEVSARDGLPVAPSTRRPGRPRPASSTDDGMSAEKKREVRAWLMQEQKEGRQHTEKPLSTKGPIPQEGYVAYANAH